MIISGRQKAVFRYRHLGRYGEIVSVLIKYGFGDLLSRMNVERYLGVGRRFFKAQRKVHLENISRWDRLRMAIEELGPTFIKLGQFASNRPDILPLDLIESLEKLQDAVLPFSEIEAAKLIETELKKPISELFADFERTPFASASIAQVHRATLNNGDIVAVKVQRPRIAESVSVDISIMYHLATLIEKHVQGVEIFNPIQFVDEFSGAIQKELDFNSEALHMDHFRHNFKDDPFVLIPQVYREFTTRKIITTRFIDGIKITNIKELLSAGLDPKVISSRGADIVLRQIFEHGFFHADPHAGNILITSDGVICLLDLGMTGILTPTSRERLSAMIIGVANKDPQKIVKTLYTMSDQQLERIEDLEYEISELLQEYASRSLASINVGEVMNRLARLLIIHRIKLIPGFYLLVKALVTMEGIGYRLDPDFNMMKHLEPFAKKLIQQQYNPLHIAQEAAVSTQDFLYLLRDLPFEAREIIQMVKSGRTRIEFAHRGLDPMLRKFDQIVNRLVFGVVLSSLVIGSSIVVLAGIPPKIYGMPIIGIGGFLTAGIMGFSLLISIIRHEKM